MQNLCQRGHSDGSLCLNGGHNTVEERNGSWDSLGAKEAKDTKLCKTSIVDLGPQSLLLGLLGHALVESKGVVKALEGDGVGDGIESGVLARDASLGVVSKTRLHSATGGQFAVKFKEANEENDLNAGGEGEGIPLLGGRKVGGGEGSAVHGHGPGEVDVGLHAVADEGGHGDTAVLDLGLSEPANGELVTLSPESRVGDTKGVEEANDGVELGSKFLEISLRSKGETRELEIIPHVHMPIVPTYRRLSPHAYPPAKMPRTPLEQPPPMSQGVLAYVL